MALVNDFGESKVTIKRQELLEAIKTNRAQHKKDYEQAYIGFKIAAEEKMVEHLNTIRTSGEVKLSISLAVPQDHSKEYDVIIKMLEMSTADEISVSQSQFTQYVMDDWNWKAGFVGTTALYGKK